MPQTGEVTVRVASKLTSSLDLSTPTSVINESFSNIFSNGTGANQASNVWGDERTLLTATNEDLDLASGGLSNGLGSSLTFTEVKAIIIHALPTNTGNLVVTRPAANGVPFLLAAGDGFTLKPGGLFVITDPSDAGIAVTAGTGDLININNATGASQTYTVIIIGVA